MRAFKFRWIDGKVEIGYGHSVANAFTNLGYGAGAIRALDSYEEIKDNKEDDKIEQAPSNVRAY